MLILKHFDFFRPDDFFIVGEQIIQLAFAIKWILKVQLKSLDTEGIFVVELRFLVLVLKL